MSYSDDNSTSTYHPLPNLADPLPPSIHFFRLQVTQYVVVACLTLCVWDWLLALADEFEMVRRGHQLVEHLLHGTYAIIRVSPIIHLAKESDFNSCKVFTRFIAGSSLLIMPAASGLFFVRLSGVYSRDKRVLAFFGSCWLVILVIFIYDTVSVLLRSSNGNHSMLCFSVKPFDGWGYMGTAIYDTLMYIAISWRLASFNRNNHWKARVRTLLTGGGLDGLSKVLLHSGQAYYFVTVGFNICCVVFIYSPAVPLEWRPLLLGPNITITSIMACRLFRELKLGQFADPMTEVTFSTIVHKDISQQQSIFELCPLGGDEDIDTSSNGMPNTRDIENPASL